MEVFIGLGLILAAYFFWRFVIRGDALVLIGPPAQKRIQVAVAEVIPNQKIVLAVNNPGSATTITSIVAPRSVVSLLELDPPEGFVASPLPLSEQEAHHPQTVAFVEEFNRENVQWVGRYRLKPKALNYLEIPSRKTASLRGRLTFELQGRWGLGSSIEIINVDLH